MVTATRVVATLVANCSDLLSSFNISAVFVAAV
jgi:hypothetical protein